jgi:hypothetical protein
MVTDPTAQEEVRGYEGRSTEETSGIGKNYLYIHIYIYIYIYIYVYIHM